MKEDITLYFSSGGHSYRKIALIRIIKVWYDQDNLKYIMYHFEPGSYHEPKLHNGVYKRCLCSAYFNVRVMNICV